MRRFKIDLKNSLTAASALALLSLAAPAGADVRDGVDAWSRGEYAQAVSQWEGPAAAGDADAMFNLGQAYRLGRGVAQDDVRARALYSRAAQSGHVQAADTYGLMLFQDGQVDEALPLVQDAARRGDPRSQYLLGIAHFNGDIVDRDWVRAYALLTLANSAGLPQAVPAIVQMDEFIPLENRQQAAGLANQMRAEADAARAAEFAAADLGSTIVGDDVRPSSRIPRPIATTAVSPSVAAARDAIDEAQRATGAQSPAQAGATFASASAPPPLAQSARQPGRVSGTVVAQRSTPVPAPAPAPAPAPQVTNSGPWRVQLGAFSVAGNAERLWASLSSRREIAGRERLLLPTGRVTRLQAGGYATRAEAESACRSLQRSGQDCLVTRR